MRREGHLMDKIFIVKTANLNSFDCMFHPLHKQVVGER